MYVAGSHEGSHADNRLRETIEKIIGDTGTVLFLNFVEDGGYHVIVVDTRKAALKVYHAYCGDMFVACLPPVATSGIRKGVPDGLTGYELATFKG